MLKSEVLEWLNMQYRVKKIIIPENHRGNVISTNTNAAINQTNQRKIYITKIKLGNQIHLGLISNQHRMVKTSQTLSLNIIFLKKKP